jgi:ABC-type glycerol-3-phosphate transport system permease component
MSENRSSRSASDERLNLIDHLARRLNLTGFIFAISLTFFLVSILFPFYWMVSSSFKSRAEIGGRHPVYIPGALRLDAFLELFDPSHPSFQNFGVNV